MTSLINTKNSLNILGSNGFKATATFKSRDKTLNQAAEHAWHIDSDNGDHFVIRIPPEVMTRTLCERALLAFRFNPSWREHFRIFSHSHSSVILLDDNRDEIAVDKSLAIFVSKLIEEGFPVSACCEGDNHPMGRLPFIRFKDSIPSELESVWSALGWMNMDNSVKPIPVRGHSHTFRKIFMLILDDWYHNDLDVSFRRYQVSRVADPILPALPPLNAQAMAAQKVLVSKRVKKVNGKARELSFDDMVNLRSGRDALSRLTLEELRAKLVDDPVLFQLEKTIVDDDVGLRRALRWRLRGLDMSGIMKKYKVDNILLASKQPKNKDPQAQ